MAYKDPEAKRQADARYYAANRERINERKRQYYAANLEQQRARKSPEANYAQVVRWRLANPEKLKEERRRYRAANREKLRLKNHRDTRSKSAALWHEQGGRCYLCGERVPLEKAHLDHDHRCCPRNKWCPFCIRGVACGSCNPAIGLLRDDPDLMERVAGNLRAKLTEMDERLAARPVQGVLIT